MKATGFLLFEFDDNEETLITYVYPAADKDLRTVIQETGSFMINSNVPELYSAFGSKYLYFRTKRNTSRSSEVRVFGICVLADNLHPELYSEFTTVLIEIYHDHGNPPRVLRSFLSSMTDGSLEYQGIQFSDSNFEESCFTNLDFMPLIERTGQNISTLWQALITGKSVGVYCNDISLLQKCTTQVYALTLPGQRTLLPFVLETSSTMTDAADSAKFPIWCSTDPSILNNRFDLCVNLSQKTVVASPALQKELTSDLLQSLRDTIQQAVNDETSVSEAIEEFNKEEIISTLQMIKDKLGDTSPASIASVKLPPETKALLTACAQAGILQVE